MVKTETGEVLWRESVLRTSGVTNAQKICGREDVVDSKCALIIYTVFVPLVEVGVRVIPGSHDGRDSIQEHGAHIHRVRSRYVLVEHSVGGIIEEIHRDDVTREKDLERCRPFRWSGS